jgi:hypothetical protein
MRSSSFEPSKELENRNLEILSSGFENSVTKKNQQKLKWLM